MLASSAAARQKSDLTVKAVSGPAAGKPGAVLTVSDTVKNKGKGKAGKSQTGYALSKDGDFSAKDIDLGGSRKVPKLGAKEKSSGEAGVTVPGGVKPGTYFLIACADAAEVVKEGSESNNCRPAGEKLTIESPAAALSISPPAYEFETVTVGTTSSPAEFTVTNTGDANSSALNAAAVSGGPGYAVGSDGCKGNQLVPGEHCSIEVEFTPPAAGPATGSVRVSAPGLQAAQASLSATGTDPAQLSFSPGSHDFSNTLVGTQSAPFAFTVTNVGDEPSGPVSTLIEGANPDQFEVVTDNCEAVSLGAGESCVFGVRFAPDVAGAGSASLNASAPVIGSATASVFGNGIDPASLSIDPASWDFGTTAVSSDSTAKTFTVTNPGDLTTGSMSVSLTGTNADQFSVTGDTCSGQTLGPAASCTVSVKLSPTTLGGKSATVSILGAPGESASATLTGTGATPPHLEISPTSYAYGTYYVNEGYAEQVFTVTNSGGTSSSSLSLQISGTGSSQFGIVSGPTNTCSGQVLAAGGSCSFEAYFYPTSTGSKSATLSAIATQGGTASATLTGGAINDPCPTC